MARSEVAKIAWDNPARLIGARDMGDAALRTAVISVYGISWNRAAIATPITNHINDAVALLLLLLRNSSFPYREYGRLAFPLKDSYTVATNFMNELTDRHRIADQLRLELSFGWGAIVDTALFLQTQDIPPPFNLGALSPSDFQPLTTEPQTLIC